MFDVSNKYLNFSLNVFFKSFRKKRYVTAFFILHVVIVTL